MAFGYQLATWGVNRGQIEPFGSLTSLVWYLTSVNNYLLLIDDMVLEDDGCGFRMVI